MIEPAQKEVHEVRINQAHNGGFIISVGCMTFVCGPTRADIRQMMDEIGEYLIDPKVYELTFRKAQRHVSERIYGECGMPAGNVRATQAYSEPVPTPDSMC